MLASQGTNQSERTVNTHYHRHTNQHINVERLLHVPNNNYGNSDTGTFAKMGKALTTGYYKSLESIPTILIQLVTQQVGASLLRKFFVPVNPHEQLNRCTNFLELAMKLKKMGEKSSYEITIKKYKMEVEKLKKLAPKGLDLLLDHATILKEMNENNLSLWQENNYKKIITGYRPISFEKFLCNQKKQALLTLKQTDAEKEKLEEAAASLREAMDQTTEKKAVDQSDSKKNQEASLKEVIA